ncbi:hypothetical protein [Microvirga massiliensis]|uniref:hypothetical protein n=1 Tax=Microvirga massiliensis TaxID=1033741 RepID=UPI00062B5DC7|nr:hypothetical protein [Microvirga massiliensis]
MLSSAQLRTLRLLAEGPAYRIVNSPRQDDYTWIHHGDQERSITRTLHALLVKGHATVTPCKGKAVITEEGKKVMAMHRRATLRAA